MKTFKDLTYEPHPHAVALKEHYGKEPSIDPYIKEVLNGTQARMDFANSYGISVLCGILFYSNGRDTYEVAVLYEGELIRYFPEDSVRGWITADEVTEIMKEVQERKE